MVLENPRSREQPSKNSLVSFGGKTKQNKKNEGREQEREQLKKKKKKKKEIRLSFYALENVIYQRVCVTAIDLEVR